jgi:hypothetical protein
MLREHAVCDPNHIGRDPTARPAMTRESSVDDDKIVFGHDGSVFVSQRRRRVLDQIEEAVSAGADVSAMLDIIGRPELRRRRIISPIEERIKCVEHEGLVCFFDRLWHFVLPPRGRRAFGDLAEGEHAEVDCYQQRFGDPLHRLVVGIDPTRGRHLDALEFSVVG